MKTDKKPEEFLRTVTGFSRISFLTIHFDPLVREELAFFCESSEAGRARTDDDQIMSLGL
jgi:hypothetical protein